MRHGLGVRGAINYQSCRHGPDKVFRQCSSHVSSLHRNVRNRCSGLSSRGWNVLYMYSTMTFRPRELSPEFQMFQTIQLSSPTNLNSRGPLILKIERNLGVCASERYLIVKLEIVEITRISRATVY